MTAVAERVEVYQEMRRRNDLGRARYQWIEADREVRLRQVEREGRIRFRWEYDEDYRVEDEDPHFAAIEIRRLDSGEWTAEGCMVDVLQPCGHWDEHVASVWGVVLDRSSLLDKAYRREIERDLAVEAGVLA